MKRRVFRKLTTALAAIAMLFASSVAMNGTANADVTVEVNPGGAPWLGFMNVFELDRSGAPADPVAGGFIFGSGWGVPDLTADFSSPNLAGTLTLGPNTVGDPDPFWYDPSGMPGALGNKWMDASLFQQVDDGSFSGMDVTFEGTVLSNSLTSAHTTNVFIRDFAPDFSSFTETTALASAGAFSITHTTDPGAGRHIQYGFNTQGENVWVTDVGPFGTVVVATVPEPGSLMVLGLGAIGLISRRRRR